MFSTDNCTYLGHRIGQAGVKPEESKIMAVNQMPRPETKKQERILFGMTGYYRRFVWDYATVVELLTELLKKNLPEMVE